MTRSEIIAAWNAQADHMNSWQHLGEDEKLDWAMKLEREACALVCINIANKPSNVILGVAINCAAAIISRSDK